MHFVVTGGAGFIGSHLTERLLAEGHRVTVVDNLTTGYSHNLPEHPDLALLSKSILACQPEDFSEPIDAIAHLAATPSVTDSWSNPLAAHNNNLSATVHVIQLCQALQVPRLVFASSAAVYGGQATLPISETQTAQPISPYGLQKLVSEQYGKLFAEQSGFSFVALRLFNVYGERQLPTSEYSGVISIFTAAMRNNQPITIYGDGTQTRDFIYVKDAAKAFTRALVAPMIPGCACICNIATGQSLPLNQVVKILQENFPSWTPTINFSPARLGDIQNSQADVTQANLLLDFRACISLQDGLSSLVNFSPSLPRNA